MQRTNPSQHACGYRAVANVLDLLRHVSAPSDVLVGRVGGGPARHKFFDAPLTFASIDAVERLVNQVWLYFARIPSSWVDPGL